MAEALKVLQSIDEIAHQIGTVATLVGMHDELGDKQGAMKVFDSAIKFWEAKVRSGVGCKLVFVSLVMYVPEYLGVALRGILRQRISRHPTIQLSACSMYLLVLSPTCIRQSGEDEKLVELLGQSASFKMRNGSPQDAAKDFEVGWTIFLRSIIENLWFCACAVVFWPT